MNILAVDFGLKHVGLAISEGELAEPYGELINDNRLSEQLQKICRKNSINTVVFGLPEGKLVPIIKQFALKFQSISAGRRSLKDIKIVFQDETLTSEEAKIKMVQSRKKLKKRQKEKHIVAACLILQDYLDLQIHRR